MVAGQINEIMFGMASLTTFRCGISFAKGKLLIWRSQVALIRKDGVGWWRRVQVAGRIEIPPLAQVDVPSKVLWRGEETEGCSTWMMEHKEFRHGVRAARVLLPEGVSDAMVRFVNTRREPTTLQGDEVLGVLVPVGVVSVPGHGQAKRLQRLMRQCALYCLESTEAWKTM